MGVTNIGDRGQVFIKDVGVYLYTHWGASELINTVKEAMKRGVRWTDPEYLARIIFYEMAKADPDGSIGFGIGTTLHSDAWRVITIDCKLQIITVRDYGKLKLKKSFQEFAPQRKTLIGEQVPV